MSQGPTTASSLRNVRQFIGVLLGLGITACVREPSLARRRNHCRVMKIARLASWFLGPDENPPPPGAPPSRQRRAGCRHSQRFSLVDYASVEGQTRSASSQSTGGIGDRSTEARIDRRRCCRRAPRPKVGERGASADVCEPPWFRPGRSCCHAPGRPRGRYLADVSHQRVARNSWDVLVHEDETGNLRHRDWHVCGSAPAATVLDSDESGREAGRRDRCSLRSPRR